MSEAARRVLRDPMGSRRDKSDHASVLNHEPRPFPGLEAVESMIWSLERGGTVDPETVRLARFELEAMKAKSRLLRRLQRTGATRP